MFSQGKLIPYWELIWDSANRSCWQEGRDRPASSQRHLPLAAANRECLISFSTRGFTFEFRLAAAAGRSLAFLEASVALPKKSSNSLLSGAQLLILSDAQRETAPSLWAALGHSLFPGNRVCDSGEGTGVWQLTTCWDFQFPLGSSVGHCPSHPAATGVCSSVQTKCATRGALPGLGLCGSSWCLRKPFLVEQDCSC